MGAVPCKANRGPTCTVWLQRQETCGRQGVVDSTMGRRSCTDQLLSVPGMGTCKQCPGEVPAPCWPHGSHFSKHRSSCGKG